MTAQRHVALKVLRLSINPLILPRSIFGLLLFLVTVLSLVVVPNASPAYAQDGGVEAQVAGRKVFIPVVRTASAPSTPPKPSPSTGKTVQQSFFYDKGRSTTASIAETAGLVILPRGKSSLRNELRTAGYQGKAVQYFLSNQVAGPGPYANSSAACDNTFAPYVLNHVAFQKGDFCTYIHPNESWFLHNSKGERLYASHPDGVSYHMNPASSGWRAFALKRMTRDLFGDSTQAKLGWDGIFLDNLHLKIYSLQKQERNSDGVVQEFADSNAYRTAVRGYLAQLSDAIRSRGSVLWANLTDDWEVSIDNQMSYLQYLDGAMNEAWALGYQGIPLNATQWDTVLTLAETAQASGKGLLAVVQGNQSDTTRQQFGLASYLLIANGGPTYFRYADAAAYGSWWQYENYNVALGAPKGKRYQVGSSWRRDFACGYVEADPTARTGKIVQRTCN